MMMMMTTIPKKKLFFLFCFIFGLFLIDNDNVQKDVVELWALCSFLLLFSKRTNEKKWNSEIMLINFLIRNVMMACVYAYWIGRRCNAMAFFHSTLKSNSILCIHSFFICKCFAVCLASIRLKNNNSIEFVRSNPNGLVCTGWCVF